MAVMDEFKEERERMKTQPFKVRFEHFWDYHKYHVLAAVFALFLVGEFIYSKITATETVFMAAFIDCYADIQAPEEYESELMTVMGIDPQEEDIILDTYNLSATEMTDTSVFDKLSVHLAAHELDVFMAPEDMFSKYSKSDMFFDLRDILSQEQLAKFQDSFYYIDYAVIESGYYDNIDYTALESSYELEDPVQHSKPETMEKPIPVGIYLTGNEDFQKYYNFYTTEDQEVVFGVASYSDEQAVIYALQLLDTITTQS